MILDAQGVLSDAQAITTTANSTNVYDTGSPVRDAGTGKGFALTVQVTQAFTASGAGTLTIALIAADDTGLSTNPTTLWTTGAIPVATLAAGYKLVARVPPNQTYSRGQRYLGLIFTVATGPMTAGKITAALTNEQYSAAGTFYPRGAYAVA